MARIRTIKPEFLSDEKVGRLSPRARLLYIGTWIVADDYGAFRASPEFLRAQVFPYDDLSVAQAADLVDELARMELVRIVRVRGERYGVVSGWQKHQRIDHPGKVRVLDAADLDEAEDEPRETISQPDDREADAQLSRDSRETLASPREILSIDLGPRKGKRKIARDDLAGAPPSASPTPAPDTPTGGTRREPFSSEERAFVDWWESALRAALPEVVIPSPWPAEDVIVLHALRKKPGLPLLRELLAWSLTDAWYRGKLVSPRDMRGALGRLSAAYAARKTTGGGPGDETLPDL